MGVVDYISRPFDARVVYRRVLNTIKFYAKQRHLVTLITNQVYEKEKNNRMMISILSQIVEFRNGESGQHVLNINILTGLLLESLVQKTDKYHLNGSDRLLIITASALHDIGKIGISDRILNKAGKLTEEEFEVIKRHPIIGASILKNLALHQDLECLEEIQGKIKEELEVQDVTEISPVPVQCPISEISELSIPEDKK